MTMASPRILVVEDNPDQRDLLRRNFERAGCSVVLAESAEDAIVAYRQSSPDLAVIDLLLPGMDGSTLVALLREERPDCAIVVTSVLDPTDFPDSDDVLPKPFTRAHVERVLEKCFPDWRTND
jgi:CheY-like chemotaxis protein